VLVVVEATVVVVAGAGVVVVVGPTVLVVEGVEVVVSDAIEVVLPPLVPPPQAARSRLIVIRAVEEVRLMWMRRNNAPVWVTVPR
jgi:hypothetical protein